MILEVHDHLGRPTRIDASRVLILLDDGTPVAFSLEYQPNHVRHFRAGDPDFEAQLHMNGVRKTVVVTTLDHRSMQPLKPGGKGGIIR